MNKTLSIIIPTHHRLKSLQVLLSSLSRQVFPPEKLEVLVICNVSDSRVENAVSRFWRTQLPNIQVLCAGKRGVNKARNLGIAHATGDILYFLDDDCELLDPYQLQKIVDYHNKYTEVSAIGGGYLGVDSESVYSFYYLANSKLWIESLRKENEVKQLLGGNASYKKQVFEEGLRFDEDVIFGGAEVGLNQRLLNKGAQIKIFDDLNINHYVRLNIFKLCRKAYLQGRGRRRNQIRWGYKKGTHLMGYLVPSINWNDLSHDLGVESVSWRMKSAWFCYQFFFRWGYYRESQINSPGL